MTVRAMRSLDWRRMPLQGRVLIEASAGTGKTFNIALIYLRLLLERGLGVERILVATFTDAAAQELRERLRRRLVEAERVIEQAPASADPLHEYLRTLCADDATRTVALRRIRLARADFDRAPIATFHGFCQRVQRDFPLQSGAAFGVGAPTDESALLRECVEDFWRQKFLGHAFDAREADAVLADGPDGLLRDLGALLARDARLISADGLARIDALCAQLGEQQALNELRLLNENAKLYARSNAALRTRLGEIAVGADLQALLSDRGKAKYFSAGEFEKQISPLGMMELARHPLLIALRELCELLPYRKDFARGRVLAAALTFCREEIPRRARRRDAQTFSMLIDAVHARLHSDGGALAGRLLEEFPAALIDEFQDTDRRQFEILDRVFRDPADEPRGLLVMIGDPKQAIFGFRGGDIAAYLHASSQATQRFVLTENRRSSTALVHALNTLYALGDGGFNDPRIRYIAVEAAGMADATPYTRGGAPGPALSLHAFCAEQAPRSNTRALETLALEDCADRIAELLNDADARIGSRRVEPGDIAVLLPTNAQIAALRKLLAVRRVPCVGSGRGSVFGTDTARDLDLVLAAVADPNDDRIVRGALSTRLLGATYDDVLAWQHDPAAFERELERFAAWHELVRTCGVLALIEVLTEQCGARLLGALDGERTITDLRHLGELLADEGAARNGLEGLRSWLGAMRRQIEAGDMESSEARMLRIESDAQRVRLMTLHTAKGLEFPFVFLPLAWRVKNQDGKAEPRVLRFHDAQGADCVDVGSAQFAAHLTAHFREDLQERLRLLYVALTRAQYALHVYWMHNDAASDDDQEAWCVAAIDVVLRPLQQMLRTGPVQFLDAAERSVSATVVAPFAGPRPTYQASRESAALRTARAPLPALRPFQWLHSFSSLTRKAPLAAFEFPAADEVAAVEEESRDETAGDARLRALGNLRGPRFGDAVHAVLEKAQPGAVWPQQTALVRHELGNTALRVSDAGDPVELVAVLVDRVRTADLGGLRLSDIAPAQRVVEFEFQLPLHEVDMTALRARCAAAGFAELLPIHLTAATLHGMLTGFIDLVFAHDGRYHVLDYKTNWLGARLSDYAMPTLDTAMRAHHYDLQALLYTVALHRYLGTRLDGYTAETHLGDSWYLFLRGVGLAPGLGVWRRRWPPALICAVDAAFAGQEVQA